MFTKSKLLISTVISILLVGSALGQADALKDLIGGRASSGETEMENRGYVLNHTTKDDEGSWTYWWNGSKKKCVGVLTSEAMYTRIFDTEAPDCGQKTGMSNGTKAAIAIGAAAAAIGVAAAVHRAHDHDDDKHWENSTYESDYERGYRDGLYNNSYHNWSNSGQYGSGYGAGVRARRHQTSYSSGWGGYSQHVYVLDLIGSRASGGETQMQSRGFRNAITYKAGEYVYQTWYNGSSRQCVQVIVYDGKYWSVKDNENSPYCR